MRLTLAVTDGAEVDHRLELLEGAQVELAAVEGAQQSRPVRDIGRTRSFVLTPDRPGASYSLAYQVTQTAARPYRCPLWLPTAPTDGRSRPVRLAVRVPAGTVPATTMPALTWQALEGTTVLPHLPAFVVVPFAAAGEAVPWDVTRVMDTVALATLALASVIWLRRQQTKQA